MYTFYTICACFFNSQAITSLIALQVIKWSVLHQILDTGPCTFSIIVFDGDYGLSV